ncbi:MAG: hypothetical protein ACXITV_05000 [Luteibaculaceae bacterium]
MKKDIKIPKSIGVSVALVQEKEGENSFWYAYIINELDVALEKVLINISAYGKIDEKEKVTTNVRYLIESVEPKSAQVIEPILPESLQLTNQYWVSYYLENTLFDKKFIFVPGSTEEEFFTEIPFLPHKGVIIK